VEILKSAAAAFRRRGYHGASVEEIARTLRMTKGSLYYYFKDKEEILFFCHDYSLDILLDLRALSPRLLKKVIAKRDRFDRGIRQIIGEGMETGAFTPGDPKLRTFAILGAVNWITRWFDPKGPARSDQIGQTFADFLMAGLQTPSRRRRAPGSRRNAL
jgi:AcrR family transcriptional regulator